MPAKRRRTGATRRQLDQDSAPEVPLEQPSSPAAEPSEEFDAEFWRNEKPPHW